MTGSGPTAHCTVRAGPGCGAMGREEDKGQKANLSNVPVPDYCVCPSRRYAAGEQTTGTDKRVKYQY